MSRRSARTARLYFPYLQSFDPITANPIILPPSGFVAGIFSRTDTNRGVWKAPAGLETTILNTTGVVTTGLMTDPRQGDLNNKGVNCIRSFSTGTVVFGARTLVSSNPAYQQWKYVPVRRMALFIEQTLRANLTWVIFEPNDTPLWTAIRTSIEGFMLSLFNQGALQGSTPSQAFQVKCDSSTTTPGRHQQRHRQHHRCVRTAQTGRVRGDQNRATRRPGPVIGGRFDGQTLFGKYHPLRSL